ncbi:MAG: NAD(P)-dependent oxidoreductase [Fibromonadaceae bacterium]|jgi:UDP-glucose 4-epimerase|nr:NAD(P)-dependent oxidoreductase [Fibromonadaceae bacterium]
MKVFLTGGTGFIGHFVAKEFLERGHSLRILARNPGKIPSLAKHKDVEMIGAGLLDSEAIAKGMEGCDACVHIALGWGETPLSMLANDTAVTVLLLELAAKSGCEKFIYTSSTAAFGKTRNGANESMAAMPQDLYGATKAAGEAYVLGFSKGYGENFPNVKMKRNVIRPGYTFGHCAFPDGVTQPDRRFFNIAKAIKENQTVHLTKHDGTQFIHASQLARLYSAVLESDLNEEVFFGLGAQWISWKSITQRAIAMRPETKSVIEEEDKGWGSEPCLFSLEKMERLFGLKFNGNDFIDEHIKWNLELNSAVSS